MASTSLAQQLQKLSAPQTKVYKDTKKQVSLLFDPSEAALKDRDTFYEIGLSGLNELIALNPDFAVYQDTLFSLASKDFERAVQSKEVNQNLDQTIEKFLLQISPYFLLQSSHKAIEWLINRYHIQQYNQDAIMALILPYHGTLIFVRFIQLLEIKHNRWNWLAPIQKNGIPLASQVLHNQCVSNASTLSFIAKMVVKYVKEYKEKATQLNTVFAFFCQVAIGVIDTSKKFTEASITALLPTLMKGIESTIVDFRSSCYIVLGYLFTKTSIKRDTLNQILDKLLTTEFDLSYDVVLLITMMYEHQAHLNRMSDPIFNISVDMMNTICKYLKKFVEVRINIQPFVLAFLREILPHIQSNIGEFKAFSPLPEILINEVDLKNQGPEKIIKKAMELLNSKIQTTPETFEDVDRELLYSLLPALLDIIKTIENKDDTMTEIAAQELELNQQTALLSLKLLTRMLAAENPEPFKDVLGTITNYTCNLNISGNVMASIVLCLAELCSNLKAHALASLRRFMPALIKVLKKQRKAETPELVLLSTVTAIAKIVESLPLFLSPYLQKILYEYSILFAKWQQCDQKCSKVTAIVAKLANIRKKIAESIPPRVLIPVANETHQLLLEKENFDAIGPVMSVLADSFANVTTADFTALQHDLTAFFLTALQLRSDAAEKNIDNSVIDKAEDEVVNALVCLVLKLSETSFRPLYFKIYDWAIRTNVEGYKDRAITFYRLSSAIADRLKGLFVLFAGHFVKNAAELLDACNNSKTEDLYFDNEEKCINLVKYIIKTLHIVFLYDSQSFLNKSRFETLMQPVVDQLENTLGGVGELKGRAAEYLIPCVSQFAVATADDSLWKLLNYQILLKTRHNDAEIRLTALDCLVAMATHLGSSWLPLLAESVPFLAELLEDGDQKIETATKDAIRKLEQILGEPLEKYF
ncbi:hypothetical protein O3G_MSEX011745 [Manduca sexta]|uniref:HEAT repeat-containing protein 1 n=1 Tax=Manduca sexta TaxID=7130 RepID=A0A922CW27_MANSE|nr:hypothetical protein O3G_MSEX011745 [Manduca sexta]